MGAAGRRLHDAGGVTVHEPERVGAAAWRRRGGKMTYAERHGGGKVRRRGRGGAGLLPSDMGDDDEVANNNSSTLWIGSTGPWIRSLGPFRVWIYLSIQLA